MWAAWRSSKKWFAVLVGMQLVFGQAAAHEKSIEPLVRLAETQIAARQLDDGIRTLSRAVEIVRQSATPHDRLQYDLLRRLVDVQSLAGQLRSASASLLHMKRISERTHGRHSAPHAHALVEVADWHCRIGEFTRARRLYRESIGLLDGLIDRPALIDALSALARCYTQELLREGIATSPDSLDAYRGPIESAGWPGVDSSGFHEHVSRMLRQEGEQALQRAVRLADPAGLDANRRVSLLLQTGDWYHAKGDIGAAQNFYSAAHVVAAQNSADVNSLLAVPAYVLYPVPPSALRAHNPFGDGLKHVVDLELTVTAQGQAVDVRPIGDQAHEREIDETRNALRAARFRPRFEHGKPVNAAGVRFRQIFRVFI
jgi:hypothetical protein